MPARCWPLALLFPVAEPVRVGVSGIEDYFEARAALFANSLGSDRRKNPVSFRGGPLSSTCEVIANALNRASQVCTIDEFNQTAWLAAVELDCVLSRAKNGLDLLTKRLELHAQAAVAEWKSFQYHELCNMGVRCPHAGSPDVTGGVTRAKLQALCRKRHAAREAKLMPAPSLAQVSPLHMQPPTLCDLSSCPDGDEFGTTGQMYMVLPGERPMLLFPQPISTGTAYGYEGSQVHPLGSLDEVTHLDVDRVNKGLWFASLLVTSENLTETQALYFGGDSHKLSYDGNDPAVHLELVSDGASVAKDVCIGGPNSNLIDPGNRAEFFEPQPTLSAGKAPNARPYWRSSKAKHFMAVASKVVVDDQGMAMGTLSLDVNMSLIAQNMMATLNLTQSSYAVIVDMAGSILAITDDARRTLFNDSVPQDVFASPPRCRRGMSATQLAQCSWHPIPPITINDVANRRYHSGANLSEVLQKMFAGTSNCSSGMQMVDVNFPKIPDSNGYVANTSSRNKHLIAACAFSAVPAWGLLIGTEYPDIMDAARVAVLYRKASKTAREKLQVSGDARELTLSTQYEFSGEADMRQFPTQWVILRVANHGHIPVPMKVMPVGNFSKEFLTVLGEGDKAGSGCHDANGALAAEKPFILQPNTFKTLKVCINISVLPDLGTYIGTLHVQAEREWPRGVCFPDPIVVRLQVRAKEAKVIKILKKMAFYGFPPLIIMVIAKLFHQHWRKYYKNEALQLKTLEEAVNSVSKIAHPMVIMSAAAFKRLGRLMSHEEAQESHEAIWLYTADEVKAFSSKNKVVFISHQWTAFDVPDPTNTQYSAMVMSLETLCNAKGWQEREMYVWVDYTSIPQRNKSTQLLAINSLTVYASNVAAFVVVAPQVVHKDLQEVCNKATYQCRAWCRAEQLAHLLVSGTANMYLAENNHLTPLTSIEGWLEQSTYVFHGDLTCCRRKHEGMATCDKEFLVTPMLGLWAQLCLRVEGQGQSSETRIEEAKAIHAAINENLDNIFPRKFIFESASGLKERSLFGDLTDRLAATMHEDKEKSHVA